MITLDIGVEQQLLHIITVDPSIIKFIPKDTYNNIFNFLLQEERYEDIIKLKTLENKILDKTFLQFIEDEKYI